MSYYVNAVSMCIMTSMSSVSIRLGIVLIISLTINMCTSFISIIRIRSRNRIHLVHIIRPRPTTSPNPTTHHRTHTSPSRRQSHRHFRSPNYSLTPSHSMDPSGWHSHSQSHRHSLVNIIINSVINITSRSPIVGIRMCVSYIVSIITSM